ncbi:MAG: diacylglycerol kinase family protein [Micavibrio sp.]
MEQSFPLILNKNSGTTLRLGEERVREMIEQHLRGMVSSMIFVDGKDMAGELKKAARKSPHGVLVGGGDGSAVCAAECLRDTGTAFGILPFGTMNMLAQDLGAATNLETTLERFRRFKPDAIDCGVVNGKIFLCAAIIGFVPEGAVAREELREELSIGNLARFLTTLAQGVAGGIRHDLLLKRHIDDDDDDAAPLSTTSLVIANNSFSGNDAAAGGFSRGAIQDGKLAVYSVAPEGMLDGLTMALSMWQGNWQDHDTIRSFETEGLAIESGGEREMLITIDGEPHSLEMPLQFSIQKRFIPVLRMELGE